MMVRVLELGDPEGNQSCGIRKQTPSATSNLELTLIASEKTDV
jgi:hypothetical protein